jgi:excisionase family DNA binding protein
MKQFSNVLTVAEAAQILDRSRTLVTRYCAEGRIAGVCKFGKEWMIPRKALLAFKEKLKTMHCGRPKKVTAALLILAGLILSGGCASRPDIVINFKNLQSDLMALEKTLYEAPEKPAPEGDIS